MRVLDAFKESDEIEGCLVGHYAIRVQGVMYWCDKETRQVGRPVVVADIGRDEWKPYSPEVKEIRPEKEEVWQDEHNQKWTTREHKGVVQIICLNQQDTWYDYDKNSWQREIIHNKNGWTRLFPLVEDDSIERIEIEGVMWRINGNDNIYPITGIESVARKHYLVQQPPMKMILEIPKDSHDNI